MFVNTNIYNALSRIFGRSKKSFTFVATADMRYRTKEEVRNFSFFQAGSVSNCRKKCYDFHHLLRRFKEITFICGHTNYTSIAKINDVWHIDVGYVKGKEVLYPAMLVGGLLENDQLRNQHIESYWESTHLARSK